MVDVDMDKILSNLKNYGIFLSIIISILFISISGIFFGITYYIMDVTEDALVASDCEIQDNSLVDTCQDLWSLSVYPFLRLRSALIYGNFFFMFGLVLAILLLGYHSGKSTIWMGVMVTFVGALTYLGIELSNMYRGMLENTLFRSMMVEFTVYNKIMLNFPWFCFFVGLFAVVLSIVNYQKTAVNNPQDLTNY